MLWLATIWVCMRVFLLLQVLLLVAHELAGTIFRGLGLRVCMCVGLRR
jgi:hypothetical protein